MSGEAKFGETKNSIRNCAETEAELVIFRDLAHSEWIQINTVPSLGFVLVTRLDLPHEYSKEYSWKQNATITLTAAFTSYCSLREGNCQISLSGALDLGIAGNSDNSNDGDDDDDKGNF